MITFHGYIVILFLFAGLLFTSAVIALVWAIRTGQFDRMQSGATSIFDEEEEPLGVVSDRFPTKAKKRRRPVRPVSK